ncbi:MAG: family 20 glycosylhydrolase [Clostridia bacterium]|nr:family 20 glycosylhydrolase [Clostridia bacterium]
MHIYPSPSIFKQDKGCFLFKGDTCLYTQHHEFVPAAGEFCKLLRKKFGINPALKHGRGEGITFLKEELPPEGYEIRIAENRIEVLASDKIGAYNAIYTLFQVAEKKHNAIKIPCCQIKDAPYKEYRGMHLYLPAMNQTEEFKKIIDLLSFLKYNTVILEIGGTMELNSHPEVNQAWVDFCEFLLKFPGGPQNFQWADRYWKDSTHFEAAGGGILPKEVVRELVTYIKNKGMKVIPEIQALSHCYYLTLAHREIAEDKKDFFPDTSCPQCEDTYKLYFDVAEEIIEVFEPEIVSIGHDEIRIMGECPDCKDKKGEELLSYEICKLHAFYKERNIRVMMWAEKLLEPVKFAGHLWGGNFEENTNEYGKYWRVPEMYKAIDGIPNDIIMLDWYHSRKSTTETCYTKRSFEVMYGNFCGYVFGDWEKRSPRVMGAEISSWCPPNEFTLGRNGVLFDLIFTSELLWNNRYSDENYTSHFERAIGIVPTVKFVMNCPHSPYLSGDTVEIVYQGKGDMLLSPQAGRTFNPSTRKFLDKLDEISATAVNTGDIMIKLNRNARSLVFLQAFNKMEEYYHSYNFITVKNCMDSPSGGGNYLNVDLPRWSAAVYVVLYEDGKTELIKATYGLCGANINMDWSRRRLTGKDSVAELDVLTNDVLSEELSPHYHIEDMWLPASAYFTTPIRFDDKTLYAYEWINPYPNKKISRIKAINTTHDTSQSVLLFALGLIK